MILVQFPGKAEEACLILKMMLFHEEVHDRIKEGIHKAGSRYSTLDCLQKIYQLFFHFTPFYYYN